jgi:hypothetical protein
VTLYLRLKYPRHEASAQKRGNERKADCGRVKITWPELEKRFPVLSGEMPAQSGKQPDSVADLNSSLRPRHHLGFAGLRTTPSIRILDT